MYNQKNGMYSRPEEKDEPKDEGSEQDNVETTKEPIDPKLT
jgi:hypothetical protein